MGSLSARQRPADKSVDAHYSSLVRAGRPRTPIVEIQILWLAESFLFFALLVIFEN